MIVRAAMPLRAASVGASWRRRVTAVVLFAALIELVAIGDVRAVDPPAPGPLDRTVADLALFDAGTDPDGAPKLITLDTIDLPAGSVRVSLLDRSTGWQAASSEILSLFEPDDGAQAPWLVELESGRVAVLSNSDELERAAVVLIRVDPERTSIEVGPVTSLAIPVDDAGAIDIDGDGANELVLASAGTRPQGDTCQGSVIQVLDGATLEQRAEWPVPDVRLAGGVLGEWDGRAGGDLLAYTYHNCPAGPDSPQGLGLVAIRLADGLPIVALASADPSASTASPGVPLAADFDGDGRNEAVIRDGAALVVLDPAHDWARSEVARGDPLPLIATALEGSARLANLVWLEHAEPEDNMVVAMGTVARSPNGSLAVTAEHFDLAAVAPARRARVLYSMRQVVDSQAALPAWTGDLDGDGCGEILAPLVTIECTRDTRPTKVGATWFATRPVVAFEAGGARELLIAATVEWKPGDGGPLPPNPAAIGPPGHWRHGPSSRFVLSEVRAADVAYFSLFPVPRPTIERAPIRGQTTDFPGFIGTRVLLRLIGVRPDSPPALVPPNLDSFLSNPASDGEIVAVARIAVPAGAESGRDGSFVRVSLADVVSPDGGPAERWTVTIAQINDWGEIAGPVRGTIVRDSTGPTLTLDTPFLSMPWPFEATVHGRSEPGVEVHGGTGGSVTSDRRGRFELKTQLAPWPQSVELIAIDESGNRTTRVFSLVGGADYRAFPWPAIVAVSLLVGAAISAGRGTRIVTERASNADNDPEPEIEELPSVHFRADHR